jgi:hypothetical protein
MYQNVESLLADAGIGSGCRKTRADKCTAIFRANENP